MSEESENNKRENISVTQKNRSVYQEMDRFDDFITLSLDWFFEVDTDFLLTYSNHQLEVLSSKPLESMIGEKFGASLGWDIDAGHWQEFRDSLKNGDVIDDFTHSFVHPLDGFSHFSIAVKPILNEDEVIIGYRGCARDITVEVNNSLNAELIEERLTDTIECIPYGIALFDRFDKLVFLNTKHRNLFPQMDDLMVTGTPFEDIVRGSIERGIQPVDGDIEVFVRKRMSLHRNGYGTREVKLSNERWVELTEHETIEGGTVISWMDLTPVKRREKALASLLEDATNNWSVPERAAKAIAVALGCRWAGVVKIDEDDNEMADMIALWDTDQLISAKPYSILNSPCEQVYREKNLIRVRESLDLNYPDRKFLSSEKVYNYRGFALRNSKGDCIGHVFAAHDSTENENYHESNEIFRLISHWVEIEFRRQYVQRKMIDSQKRFRDFAEVASDWFWEIDEDLNYTFISEHAGTEGQIKLQQLLKKAHEKVDSTHVKTQETSAPSKNLTAYQPFKDVSLEIKGRSSENDRILKVSGRPILTNDGEFKGYRGTGSDVTELIAATQRASQAEQWLAEAIESSPEAFALYDSEDKLIICNQRFKDTFFSGIQHKVEPGMYFDDLQKLHFESGLSDIPEEEIENFWAHRKAHRGQQNGSPGRELLTNGRSYLALEHRTADGGIASFYVDITNLRENERNLRHAKEMAESASRGKSEFLANVSHELRTPLNAIIGFSELVRDDLAGPANSEKYKEYVNDIHSSGMHLMELINDILDLSKAEAGLISQEARKTDMREIIDSSIKFIMPRANKAEICVSHEYPDDPNFPKLWIDPKRAKQIMLNLISNAVKFTPDGGHVDVKAKINSERALEICVIDTGIGMSEEDLPKAMEAFGQVDSTLSRKYEGTGLGLPLTKRLIDSNNGTLKIHSVPGEGTVVTICFPKECLRT